MSDNIVGHFRITCTGTAPMGLIPTKSYEDLLGDGIELLLARKAATLADLVAGLNELNVRGPAGQAWTEELLAREFQRLGS